MTYLQRLNPWCIIRPFPDMRTLIVGRFRRRVDAEGHLRIYLPCTHIPFLTRKSCI
jgi:hypothetical protein